MLLHVINMGISSDELEGSSEIKEIKDTYY